jgi:hypothetical protein
MESMLDVLDKVVTKSGQHTTTFLHHSTSAAHSIGNSATTTLAKNAMAYGDQIHSGNYLSLSLWLLSLSIQSLSRSLARARALSLSLPLLLSSPSPLTSPFSLPPIFPCPLSFPPPSRVLFLSPPHPTLIFHLRARFSRGLPTAWHDPKLNANA